MAVYKRGGVWWYSFVFNGQRIQESSKHGNKRVAETMQAAHKTSLAKGEVGIRDHKPVPTLKEFAPRFRAAIETRCAEKPRTVAFYKEKLSRLLEYDPLASAKLDAIDEGLIEKYVQYRRKRVSPATVNRQLATLRRLLRLANEWKVIASVPRIRLLPGERNREFVLNHTLETLHSSTLCPQPLHDVAILILDTGLRVGEALGLEWRDIHFNPGANAKFGYLQVRDGKSRNARRTISLTVRASAMLQRKSSQLPTCCWVFPGKSHEPFVGTSLNHQHQKARAMLKLPKDFVIHSSAAYDVDSAWLRQALTPSR